MSYFRAPVDLWTLSEEVCSAVCQATHFAESFALEMETVSDTIHSFIHLTVLLLSVGSVSTREVFFFAYISNSYVK